MAKEFFQSKAWPYEEFNVISDLNAQREMIEATGQMGVPVIMINDKVIVGFDRQSIDEAMKTPGNGQDLKAAA